MLSCESTLALWFLLSTQFVNELDICISEFGLCIGSDDGLLIIEMCCVIPSISTFG